MKNENTEYVLIRLPVTESASSRSHLVDRALLRKVPSGAHTKFVPVVKANEQDATGQLIVKNHVRTLCDQPVNQVHLAPLESTICQTCQTKAGAGRIVAASGFRS